MCNNYVRLRSHAAAGAADGHNYFSVSTQIVIIQITHQWKREKNVPLYSVSERGDLQCKQRILLLANKVSP